MKQNMKHKGLIGIPVQDKIGVQNVGEELTQSEITTPTSSCNMYNYAN